MSDAIKSQKSKAAAKKRDRVSSLRVKASSRVISPIYKTHIHIERDITVDERHESVSEIESRRDDNAVPPTKFYPMNIYLND